MLTKDEFADWCDKNIGTDYAFEAAWQTYQAFFLGIDDSLTTLQNIARLELARAELDVKIAYMKALAMLEAVSSLGAAKVIMTLHQSPGNDSPHNLKLVADALAHGLIGYDKFCELLESFPALIYVIAANTDLPVGQLRVIAKEGKLSTKFIVDALEPH